MKKSHFPIEHPFVRNVIQINSLRSLLQRSDLGIWWWYEWFLARRSISLFSISSAHTHTHTHNARRLPRKPQGIPRRSRRVVANHTHTVRHTGTLRCVECDIGLKGIPFDEERQRWSWWWPNWFYVTIPAGRTYERYFVCLLDDNYNNEMGQNFCHQEKHIYLEYEIDCLLNIATIKYKISFLVIYKFNGDTMNYYIFKEFFLIIF